ncbi:hypothetical protein LSH36_480g00002 [Paralvinella palmiformis]|uniref:Uncharacterized protein n=1 Tax=Paralvinella palmiformis TaxID=53620 RepID=A0AAD9J9N9_9ANNE|nr:hypothetical protein LSH36_480g00002 [Paralvinella palmiformis]
MEAKYLLLVAQMLVTMTTVYSIQCYSGASVNEIAAATVLSGCTSCGSESFTIFQVTTRSYSCYADGNSCTIGCCYTDLCNSAGSRAQGIVGGTLLAVLVGLLL